MAFYCPCFYDWIYPANSSTQSSDEYCVKIYRPAIYIFWQTYRANSIFESSMTAVKYAFKIAMTSLEQPTLEKQANNTLHKYNLSQLKFFQSKNSYAHFKTLIKGKTFDFYLQKDYFINPEKYEMRRAFVNFIYQISHSALSCHDMHGSNIMYDETRKCWEIIDGEIEELNNGKLARASNALSWIYQLLPVYISHQNRYVFSQLFDYARLGTDYTEEVDNEIVSFNLNLNRSTL